MQNNTLVILLTALGSAISWWPACIRPGLGLSFWVSLGCAGLTAALATTLAPTNWPWLLLVSGLGTFGGMYLGVKIWPQDPIGAAWLPLIIAANTLAVIFVALCSGLIMRKQSVSNGMLRRAIWAVFLACVAFGPVTLAMTPGLARQ